MSLTLDHDFTLNPDGSGKVTLHWTGPAQEGQSAKAFMKDEIANARGVDAWSAIACTTDGALDFTGTAYFPDLAKVRFHCAGFHSSDLDFAWEVDDEGRFHVRNVLDTSSHAVDPSIAGLSDAQLRERLEGEREKFKAMRGFIEGMFGGMKCNVTLRLPGKVGAAKNAKKVDAKSVRHEGSGDDLIAAIGRIIEDDELMIKVMRTGQPTPELLQEILGGDIGPVDVTTTGRIEPSFNYELELQFARDNFGPIAAEIGSGGGPVRGESAKGTRVGGVRIVREDDDSDTRPFNYSKGLTFALLVSLPGPAVSLKEARFDTAVLDSGVNIAPEDEWHRRISFPKLSADRTQAGLEIQLPLPPPEAAGFKEITGVITCVVAEGTKEIDLGFERLETGAQGKELSAVIEKIEDDSYTEGHQRLEIKLGVAHDGLQALALKTADGSDVALRQGGYSSCNDECTFQYSAEGAVPADGRLIASVYAETRHVEVPFVLSNVDLLGQPRAAAAADPAPAAKKEKKRKK
jgi:hypothetical protein